MKLSLLAVAGLAALSQATRVKRDHANNDYYVLHLARDAEPAQVAARLGLEHQGELELAGHHVFRAAKTDTDLVDTEIKARKRRKRDILDDRADVVDGVLLSQKQTLRSGHLEKRIPPRQLIPAGWSMAAASPQQPVDWAVQRQTEVMRDLDISDPIFTEQWHLYNTVQPGHDVNVTDVWSQGITGTNVTVAIIDDGLDMYSNDLKANYFAAGSWDYNDHDPEPKPVLSDDRHGTRCAGEVAAARNDVCGVGVAYDANIAGIRILSGELTNADEAEAMIYKYQDNDIYSCSWGPPDDGRHMEAPDILIKRAMLQGVQEGRGGKGSVYVFASGNGAAHGDNCNFDGYTNSIYSITVGAVDRAGNHPYYSEHCSANLVVTYSSGAGDSIHTTDVGVDKCYDGHGGTSAAAPLAAGIFALVLSIRPDLSWRDLQYLALHSAAPVADTNAGWQDTAIGKQFSHIFGYGKVDSWAMVEMAKDWDLVKPQAWWFSPWQHVKKPIPEGKEGLSVHFDVTTDMLKEANLERVEHVTVTMNVEHTRRGDISVDLISPEGVVSHIATDRMSDEEKAGYDDWTFMSVAHWGESGVGKWTIIVKDNKVNNHQGVFVDWHLKLWGESIDADKATLLPMPNPDDDADHDKTIVPTVTAEPSTATAPPRPDETFVHDTQPTDHPVRPTKPAKPNPTQEDKGSMTGQAEEASSEATPSSETWISWLPSLGASKAAQPWIYGALGLIVAFCIALGIALFIVRRRRIKNDSRSNYEFEMLDEEESEGLTAGEKPAGVAGGRKKRRGGELYDAFAGGSEDEDEGSEFDRYEDREPSQSARSLPGERDGDQFALGGESDEDDSNDEAREKRRPT
ncbi:Protease-like protein [Emericellopsis cladophorae]|uniref:Protease-like protein n=1 Tax=Emericellopsis cladophorae TaxID=2686198 RepID=A0A9P9Y6W6_9HYPO|nr:Protease-like protein [Emericellopsis cladophorae]KAI6784614.1 Protease-like protein [Emericellopsis cladophorae]